MYARIKGCSDLSQTENNPNNKVLVALELNSCDSQILNRMLKTARLRVADS